MFRKVNLPVSINTEYFPWLFLRSNAAQISGLVLNTSYFLCPGCDSRHRIFGSPESFINAAKDLKIPVLGQLPLVPAVNAGGDAGVPFMLTAPQHADKAATDWRNNMADIASKLWDGLPDRE